ncbi:hypothetical protein [Streptomyces sp. NPDC093099]|uniref:hypothetical protein n=1 Tax=Streptomyces sp. NPDC093099 TaxID=3366028 RepID=UPI0037FFAD8A
MAQDPVAGEVPFGEPGPVPQAGNPVRVRQELAVLCLHLFTAANATQVAQHLGIGIELDLMVKVLIRQRDQMDPLGVQDRLKHATYYRQRQIQGPTGYPVLGA